MSSSARSLLEICRKFRACGAPRLAYAYATVLTAHARRTGYSGNTGERCFNTCKQKQPIDSVRSCNFSIKACAVHCVNQWAPRSSLNRLVEWRRKLEDACKTYCASTPARLTRACCECRVWKKEKEKQDGSFCVRISRRDEFHARTIARQHALRLQRAQSICKRYLIYVLCSTGYALFY